MHAFHIYLLWRSFTIQTDHCALEWLDRLKENNPWLTRWSLVLIPYDFHVEHCAGGKNGNADALARMETNSFVSGEGGRGVKDPWPLHGHGVTVCNCYMMIAWLFLGCTEYVRVLCVFLELQTLLEGTRVFLLLVSCSALPCWACWLASVTWPDHCRVQVLSDVHGPLHAVQCGVLLKFDCLWDIVPLPFLSYVKHHT